MTGQITMFDTDIDDNFPTGGEAYAAYVDGHVGSQPNYDYIVKTFPTAKHLGITVFPGVSADTLDIEPGAAVPTDVPAWYSQQRDRGEKRPCLYSSVDEMAVFVLPLIESAGIARPSARLWSAHYTGSAHICGPKSCGLLPIDADGTQWTSTVGGKSLDQSLLLPDFFTTPGPPEPHKWTYGPATHLQAHGGDTTVRLDWNPPLAPGHPHPAAYQFFIYEGVACNRSTLVATYPRGETEPGNKTAFTWQGGSLKEHTSYTAHVVAAGPDGTRVRPNTYASVQFTTG
jgi:hypothetical protein